MPGSWPATAALVSYLGEVRKHGGLMTPLPVQAAAAAALGDDEHVAVQRARYATGAGPGCSRHSKPPASCTTADRRRSTCGCAMQPAMPAAGPSPSDLAHTGLLVAPGDFYSAGDHVRVALTQHDDRIDLTVERLGALAAIV